MHKPNHAQHGHESDKHPQGPELAGIQSAAWCTLERIPDETYEQIFNISYPLFSRLMFRREYADSAGRMLTLAHYYAGLRLIFGKPGTLYDDWKGSFSFPFKVNVCRNGKLFPYALNIVHDRSMPEFRFRRIVQPKEKSNIDLRVYRDPIEHEFSQDDINTVILHIHDLLHYLRIFAFTPGNPESTDPRLRAHDFVILTPSNLIISGCINGVFFEEDFSSEKRFNAAKRHYKHLIKNPLAEWPNEPNPPRIRKIPLSLLKIKDDD